VLQGFSIGGDVTSRDGKKITGLKLIEISLVDRPANSDCRIDVVKAAGAANQENAMEDLSTPVVSREPMVPRDNEEVGWLRRMVEKLVKAADAPGNGKLPYGHTEYADPGYQKDKQKRYPIDTEEHIRAAWNYIHKQRNADKYSAKDLASIKRRIVAAWKKKIDEKGPPEAKAAEPDAENGVEKERPFESEAVDDGDEEPAARDGFSRPAKDKKAAVVALAKSMSAAGTLSCVADMLECAEDCLRHEAAYEESDPNDIALADSVCDIRCCVLDVIAAKAVHEKKEEDDGNEEEEALDPEVQNILEGADKMADPRLTKRAATGRHQDHLRKAAHHVGEAHNILDKVARASDGEFESKKAAGLAKAAHDAHERAMEHLVLARHHIHAAAGERDDAPFERDSGDAPRDEPQDHDVYEPERGIEGISQREMTEGSVSDYEADKPYPGKTARGETLSKREADALIEAAFLKGKVEALEKMPASPKARVFAVPRGAFPVTRDEEPTAKEALLKGVNLDSENPAERQRAAGRMLGNMMSNPQTFARPVLGDPNFKGAAAR
ncbi:MAG: DUF6582 domain-containing protein, partial [Acetobacteraceae bacterium]